MGVRGGRSGVLLGLGGLRGFGETVGGAEDCA